MFINSRTAHGIFMDLTRNADLPVSPDELLRSPRFQQHEHVFFGDLALRRYKHKNRWGFEIQDVYRVGELLQSMTVDQDDVVEVHLPAYREEPDRDLLQGSRADWRNQVAGWMYNRALKQQMKEGTWGSNDWKVIGANGLPGNLTWEAFVAAAGTPVIAGTLPLQMLRWSGQTWLAPRSYVQVLDRWEQLQAEATARFRTCSSCGAQSPGWGAWRTPTQAGYITRCPSCSAAAFRPYNGELDSVVYDTARQRRASAAEYLCQACGLVQASVWDHCHSHDFVRGPLCASCNTAEGEAGFSETFLRHDAAGTHLLQCRACREQQTLPVEHHRGVVYRHVEQTAHHGTCHEQPWWIWPLVTEPTVYKFRLTCRTHDAKWEVKVSGAEAATLVDAYVGGVLAEMHRGPESHSA